MITAVELREKTAAAYNVKVKQELRRLESALKNAANEGEFMIHVPLIYKENLEVLEAQGYDVVHVITHFKISWSTNARSGTRPSGIDVYIPVWNIGTRRSH